MPRKRDDESLIEVALTSRWPVAATAAAVFFVGGYLVVPAILFAEPILRPLATIARTFSLIAVVAFAAIALIKFLAESGARTSTVVNFERPSTVKPPRPRVSSRYPHAADDPVGPTRTEPFVRPAANEWSLPLLQSIEWKRFEEVIAAYFRAKGFRCETIEYGSDGGVDGRLYFGDLPAPVGVVQCKAWGSRQVGAAPVRELLGVMAHERVTRGYFCATGDFSKDAIAFAAANPIKLITGQDLLTAIAQMSTEAQRSLLAVSTTGDYTTPTCPSCGIKLVARTIGGKAAWGCRNYPRCRTKIYRKSVAPPE